MANSGSFSSSVVSGHYKLKVDWSATQNISKNQSTVTVKAYLVNDYNISIGERSSNTCVIDGTTKSFNTAAISSTGSHLLGTFSKTVTHASNGTKSLLISVTFLIKATLSGTYFEKLTASRTVTLNSISRVSSFTVTSGEIGNANKPVHIKITPGSSSFSHEIECKVGSFNELLVLDDLEFDYVPDIDFCTVITKSTSATATVTLFTYNGSALIGKTSKTITLTVPASIKPKINSLTTALVSNGVPSTITAYVQNHSKCKVTANAVGAYGSTIVSYQISGGGFSSSSNPMTTGVLKSSGTVNFSARVTDSRGRVSDVKQASINVLAYTKPKFISRIVRRCDENKVVKTDGTYGLLNANVEVCSLGGKNAFKTGEIYFKKQGASSYTKSTVAFNLGTDALFCGTFSPESSYDIKLVALDLIESSSVVINLSTALFTLDFKRGGTGVAIGKASETDNLLDVKPKTLFRNNVEMLSPCSIGAKKPGTDSFVPVFQPQNENGNTTVGFGNYDQKSGQTNIYGNTVNIGVGTVEKLYKPYFEKGDSLTVGIKTAGYVTNSKQDVAFTIPLSKPVLGNPTVKVTNIDGITLRQNEKYTHGCEASSTNLIKPTYTANLIAGGLCGIGVMCTITNTTNALNNAPIGVYFYGKIEFV